MNDNTTNLYILIGIIVGICAIGAVVMAGVKAADHGTVEREKTKRERIAACSKFEIPSDRILCLHP